VNSTFVPSLDNQWAIVAVARDAYRPRSTKGSLRDLDVRAQRFKVRMAFLFRPQGHEAWLDGTTENISRSGVMFWTQQRLAETTPIEMCFPLPLEIFGRPAARLLCRGMVVRAVVPTGDDVLSGLAATISRYRLLPRNGKGGTP
jgi:hypothetical protein